MKKVATLLGLSLAFCAFALLLFEIAYRYQWVDTYRPELVLANPELQSGHEAGRRKLLIMGDSFSVGSFAYPALLRARQHRFDVVSAAIPGTGVIEALIVAPRRFARFDPSIFIYQIYVGNDLLNIRYPVNWRMVSPARNVYWTVSRRVRSLAFLNYRLGQMRAAWRPADVAPEWPPQRVASLLEEPSAFIDSEPFDPDRYTRRVKIYLQAEPQYLERHILASGSRRHDFEQYLQKLAVLLSFCEAAKCQAYLLLIPHASQVHERYLHHAQALGAEFSDPEQILATQNPFADGLGRMLEETGIPNARILDVRDQLREKEAQGMHVYYQNDPHLSPYGQTVVTDYLLAKLDEHP